MRVLQLPVGHEVQAAADLARQQLDRKYCRSAEQKATSSRPSSAREGCASYHAQEGLGVGVVERVLVVGLDWVEVGGHTQTPSSIY
jgi:hypothetical protein